MDLPNWLVSVKTKKLLVNFTFVMLSQSYSQCSLYGLRTVW
jgi:hypothetical protein